MTAPSINVAVNEYTPRDIPSNPACDISSHKSHISSVSSTSGSHHSISAPTLVGTLHLCNMISSSSISLQTPSPTSRAYRHLDDLQRIPILLADDHLPCLLPLTVLGVQFVLQLLLEYRGEETSFGVGVMA